MLDLDKAETVQAARNSPLMNPEVISHLIDILEMGSLESKIGYGGRVLTLSSLKAYITRGFNNMIMTLGDDYIQHLKQTGLA